jgi:hypothetical protein
MPSEVTGPKSGTRRMFDANPDNNSRMNDPKLVTGFETEQVFERDTLTKTIQQHLYTLPSKKDSP